MGLAEEVAVADFSDELDINFDASNRSQQYTSGDNFASQQFLGSLDSLADNQQKSNLFRLRGGGSNPKRAKGKVRPNTLFRKVKKNATVPEHGDHGLHDAIGTSSKTDPSYLVILS